MVSYLAIKSGNSSSKYKMEGMASGSYNDKFPKKCLAAMKRNPYPKDFNFYLCGLHFTDEDFQQDLRYEVQGGKKKLKLLDTAIPSIFSFTKKWKDEKNQKNVFTTEKKKIQNIKYLVSANIQTVYPKTSISLMNKMMRLIQNMSRHVLKLMNLFDSKWCPHEWVLWPK